MDNMRKPHKSVPILIIFTKLTVLAILTGCFLWIGPMHVIETESPEEQQVEVPAIVLEPLPEPLPKSEPEPEPEPEYPEFYPVGEICVSQERNDYVSGSMILEIPRLELVSPVIDGTGHASLMRGVGLFDYAQLPGSYNSNTSLAAHRDIYGEEFYYIDTITSGDLIYLRYGGKKYTYQYRSTYIVSSADWNPIRVKEFACVTLQSCDPIGTSENRIFVEGKLISIEDDESESC